MPNHNSNTHDYIYMALIKVLGIDNSYLNSHMITQYGNAYQTILSQDDKGDEQDIILQCGDDKGEVILKGTYQTKGWKMNKDKTLEFGS